MAAFTLCVALVLLIRMYHVLLGLTLTQTKELLGRVQGTGCVLAQPSMEL